MDEDPREGELSPSAFVTSSQRWLATAAALNSGRVGTFRVPIAKPEELPAIFERMQQQLAQLQQSQTDQAGPNVSIHFEDHEEARQAFSSLLGALTPGVLGAAPATGPGGATPAAPVPDPRPPAPAPPSAMVASWAPLAPGMAPLPSWSLMATGLPWVLNPATAGLPATGAAAPVTVGQAAMGGAVIGAVGGAGIGMLMIGIKSTADALGQPILGSLGAVLCGIAAGAAGGALIATNYSISVNPIDGIQFTSGPLPSKKG